MIDPAELRRRISETAHWCARSKDEPKDLAARFRSDSLRPPDITMAGAYLRGLNADDVRRRRVQVVEELVLRRRALLALPRHAEPSDAGRVLTFELDSSFFDRIAASETQGFLDDTDLPPWDTWLAYEDVDVSKGAVLLSWVPPELIDIAQRGIAVHMCDAYAWLKV